MTRRLPKRPDARHHRWDLTSEATLDQTGTSDAPIELLETGIIKEDKLGLDVVYIQAKRWTRTVGRPEIQQFAGALAGQRARKGVFITTSTFSAEARSYVASVESKIVLIDGGWPEP